MIDINDLSDVQIIEYMHGFYAWDSGCKSSGIHDSIARDSIQKYFHYLVDNNYDRFDQMAKRFVRDFALDKNYTMEDLEQAMEWLKTFCEIDEF